MRWHSADRALTLWQIVAQLLSYPLGRLWAYALPNVKVFGISVNPGPFTVKEHVLVTIMANVGYQSAYAVRALPFFSSRHSPTDVGGRRTSSQCSAYTIIRYTTSDTSG